MERNIKCRVFFIMACGKVSSLWTRYDRKWCLIKHYTMEASGGVKPCILKLRFKRK